MLLSENRDGGSRSWVCNEVKKTAAFFARYVAFARLGLLG